MRQFISLNRGKHLVKYCSRSVEGSKYHIQLAHQIGSRLPINASVPCDRARRVKSFDHAGLADEVAGTATTEKRMVTVVKAIFSLPTTELRIERFAAFRAERGLSVGEVKNAKRSFP
ncbi:TPA: hypothetical protein ACNV18_000083 [Pseudomonas putida]|uniref:hypothetical protein n=1 Tax=Pseudomonas TaxID=286 RepID=UPI0003808BC1|nr:MULTISPECIES: hypothetical protein [Pseudomonas]ANC84183.1 hypothetical protein KKK_25530 [Pseudomonas putida B6-2]MBA6113843.1 hypothetical protein [Pseudomonas asiatica]MCZ9640478.1 hypothetical protein [Pseudomonas putida]MCZ9640946.1 hypothetical protein [Pseudomonas putida]